MKHLFVSLVILFVLKYTLSDINIATPAFFFFLQCFFQVLVSRLWQPHKVNWGVFPSFPTEVLIKFISDPGHFFLIKFKIMIFISLADIRLFQISILVLITRNLFISFNFLELWANSLFFLIGIPYCPFRACIICNNASSFNLDTNHLTFLLFFII